MIWIYTVCKGRADPGLAGLGLNPAGESLEYLNKDHTNTWKNMNKYHIILARA